MARIQDDDGTVRDYPESKAALGRYLKAGTRLTVTRSGAKAIDHEMQTVVRANEKGFATAEGGRLEFARFEMRFGPYGFEMYRRAVPGICAEMLLLFRYAEIDERVASLDEPFQVVTTRHDRLNDHDQVARRGYPTRPVALESAESMADVLHREGREVLREPDGAFFVIGDGDEVITIEVEMAS